MAKAEHAARPQVGQRVQITDADSDAAGESGTVETWPPSWTATYADPLCVRLDSGAYVAPAAKDVRKLEK